MTKGRRLRLDRRKAGLSQQELADKFGHSLEEISQMENDRLEISPALQAFQANLPARVPTGKAKTKQPPAAPETAPEPAQGEPLGEPGEAQPRTDVPGDKPPSTSSRAKTPKVVAPRGEIQELEDALLKMFAGERLIIPKQTPDGVVQTEAVIPGIAQVVGMLDEFDGRIIEVYSPGMAKAWAELARVNPRVRSVLVGLTYGGAYRGVLAASLPPVVAIMAHHGAFSKGDEPPVINASQNGTDPGPQGEQEWNGGVPPGTEDLFREDLGGA